jgi:adenylylsulfate kinase-like enzyme
MPNIILIHGPMAAGKSTITAELRKRLPDYAYVDRPYIKRGLKPLGRETAKKLSKAATYDIMREIMKLGRDMIVEELNPASTRKKLKHYLRTYDYEIHSFYLRCSIPKAMTRDKYRSKKHKPKLLRQIHEGYLEPDSLEQIIDTEKLSVRQAVNLILKSIKGTYRERK